MKRSYWLALAPVLVTGSLGLGLAGASRAAQDGSTSPSTTSRGPQAPAVSGTTFDGKPISLASLRGKVVVVSFWTEWCGGCKQEIPSLVRFYKSYHDRGVEVLSVNCDSPNGIGRAKAFLAQNGATFPVINDSQGSVQRAYRIEGYPSLFVVDQGGAMVARQVGFSEGVFRQNIVSRVDKLLASNRASAR
jgi:thiol-disulfide isomerase/thioredoxin